MRTFLVVLVVFALLPAGGHAAPFDEIRLT
jgi:hypothetical protein